MIKDTEEQIYNYLVEIMEEKNKNLMEEWPLSESGEIFKGFKVYRGFLPDNKFEDRMNGEKTNDYFPFILLKITEFSQRRENYNDYNSFANFAIWIGTKGEKNEDYLKNLMIGDYIRDKLLKESTIDKGFAIDQIKEFNVTFHKDQADSYFYSRIEFTVYLEPITSEINNFPIRI